ncbi:hypothetical protein ACKKBG_A07600 [Auxenochlorella protothecoides x Auxenochlorella symbiontica]
MVSARAFVLVVAISLWAGVHADEVDSLLSTKKEWVDEALSSWEKVLAPVPKVETPPAKVPKYVWPVPVPKEEPEVPSKKDLESELFAKFDLKPATPSPKPKPEVKLPAVTLPPKPEVEVKSVVLPPVPEIKLPAVTLPPIPEIKLPAVTLPPVPEITLPAVTLPPLPEFTLPAITLPPLPEFTLPTFTPSP